MTNYPNGFDDDTTIPPATSNDVVYSIKYTCEVIPKSFAILRNPVTGSSFILTPNKTTSLRVSAAIVQEDDPAISGQLVNYAGVYCNLTGNVLINFNQNQFSYNPYSFYEMTAESTTSSTLDIKITNKSLKRIKVSAILEYIVL
jgi:hypothetical protein